MAYRNRIERIVERFVSHWEQKGLIILIDTTALIDNEYEDYTETSKTYNQTRIPIGVDVLIESFATNSKPLNEQTILDGGCGTGNYTQALIGKVKSIHGLEYNEGMFAQAKQRFQDNPDIHLRLGNLLDLPYSDSSFDGMMCNQVLHHLSGENPDGNFPVLGQLFSEAHRVLRPNGILMINTSAPEQQRDGFWWAALIPDAIERIGKRFPPTEVIQTHMEEAGFDSVEYIPLYNEVLQGDSYLDPKGPLKKTWRNGDSTWSLVTEQEMASAQERLRRMHEDGTIMDFLSEREQLRQEVGQTMFLLARKSNCSPASL